MYTIYDIEISKEILASLSFISLESGITFSNRLQFNNIMYKLYNYVKDDFVFDNGITINEALKNKINEFKTVYVDLPNPNIEDGEKLLFTIPAASSTESTTLFADWGKLSIDALAIYEYPHKFIPSGTGSSLSCRISLFRASDGYVRYITPSAFSIPANTSYFKIRIQSQSTRYVLYVDFYTIDDALISTTTANGSTSYGPATYTTFKINYIYHSTQTIDVYDFVANDFSIDESNIANIDTSKLIENDLYYSSDISFGKDDESITINHLLKKTLNGETFGFKYGTIKTYLGLTCNYDKNIFKFLTITANEEQTAFTGYVSTYPLYATNVSGELGLWFLNTSDPIPVKVFKSENGESWSEITSNISSSLPYNGDSITVQTTALSYAGEDIIYSNYPVFYSLAGSNFEDRVIQILDDEEAINDDGIPLALEEDNTFKLYRNADEDFTLDMLPLGASFYFGKHKIEDSPRFKIVFRPMDYTNNINTTYGVENWLPNDSVYCDSVYYIDELSFHNYKNYNNTEMLYEKAHLPRWLNSDAPEGEWWTQINEYDSPSTEENMYDNASSKGYSYGHRAGFLYNFAEEEKALLQPFTGWTLYNGLKVLLMDSTEGPATSAKTYRPKLFKACGSSTVGILRPYYVNELKYHKNSTIASSCATQKNNFVSTKTSNYFWRRNKGTNSGQYADGTVNGTVAYYSNPVKPVVCIDKNVKVKREPDEYGVFSLDLPIVETIDFVSEFETDRRTTKSFEVTKETSLKITKNFEAVFNTKLVVGVSLNSVFETFREIRNTAKDIYNTIKYNTQKFEKVFETSRMHNFVFQPKYNVERRVVSNFEKTYSTERNTNEEIPFVDKFSIERRVAKDFSERFNTKLEILGVFEKTYQSRRFIRENFEVNYDTVLDVIVHREFNYPLQREVLKDFENIYNTKIRFANNFSNIFECEREVFAEEVLVYNTDRKVLNTIEEEIEGFTRFVRSRETATYETLRCMLEPTVLTYEIERRVTETHKPTYPTIRNVIKHLQALERYSTYRYVKANSENYYSVLRQTIANIVSDEVNLLRYIVQNIDFISSCERYILENITDDYDVCRSIVEDFERINEAVIYVLNNSEDVYESNLSITNLFDTENLTLREVIANMEMNYPTKRATTVTVNKYVSKDNLMLYTVLLKQEIATFIEQKINYELEKRGL